MNMLSSNLHDALVSAVLRREESEKAWNYTRDSAVLSGWKDVLRAIEKGEQIYIK